MNKRALDEARQTLRSTLEENTRLMQEREASESETYAVTEMLRRELQEKIAETERLKGVVSKVALRLWVTCATD